MINIFYQFYIMLNIFIIFIAGIWNGIPNPLLLHYEYNYIVIDVLYKIEKKTKQKSR